MSPASAVLGPLDYAVIVSYLVAITAFGSWFARYQKTTRDYFLTGRSVPGWAICCTIVATETSTLSFIGVPAQAYAGNMTFLQLVLGYIAGRFLVSVLFLPAYFRGDLVTSYELLNRRFGAPVKNLSAIVFLDHPIARGRHPPVRDGPRHRRRHAAVGVAGRRGARRGHDRLHDARRRGGGHLDRRRPAVRLRRGRAHRLHLADQPGRRRTRGSPRSGARGGQAARLRFRARRDPRLHVLVRAARRNRAHTRNARQRSVPRAAAAFCPIAP